MLLFNIVVYITALAGHQIYTLLAYAYLVYDNVSMILEFVKHEWISSVLVLGACTNASIYWFRDSYRGKLTIIGLMNSEKYTMISHLNYISLWLRIS